MIGAELGYNWICIETFSLKGVKTGRVRIKFGKNVISKSLSFEKRSWYLNRQCSDVIR